MRYCDSVLLHELLIFLSLPLLLSSTERAHHLLNNFTSKTKWGPGFGRKSRFALSSGTPEHTRLSNIDRIRASHIGVNNTETTARPGNTNANAGSGEPGLSLSAAPGRDAITGQSATATGQHRQLNENTLDWTSHLHPSFFEPPANQEPDSQYMDPMQETGDAYKHENEALGPIYGYHLPVDEDSEDTHGYGPQDHHVQQHDDEQGEQPDRRSLP
ncbi:hypothetical protein GE09DRAFT_1060335 [Coniochaeta sp. 2T2.1]|nr:hypothetical protein GE09DRAFT_1060335 [Coniochaeta sp. 2T2.1]